MNVQVNVNYIKHISQEIQEISKQVGRLSSELEDVERELRKQTEFRAQLRALRKTKDKAAEEKYKLNVLAQALANVGNLYCRTEMNIEDDFESQKSKQTWIDTGNVDLSKLYQRVNTLLYGGEN